MKTQTSRTKIIENLDEIKERALKLLSSQGKISVAMLYLKGRVSYTNAEKAIKALAEEKHINLITINDTEGPLEFWEKR